MPNLDQQAVVQAYQALPFLTKAGVVFVSTWLIDVCYALYTLRTAAHRPAAAATYGCVVYLLGAINVLGYAGDVRLLIPIFVGGWLGTYMAVWREAQGVRVSATDRSPSSTHH
jgi:hypothetical protein